MAIDFNEVVFGGETGLLRKKRTARGKMHVSEAVLGLSHRSEYESRSRNFEESANLYLTIRIGDPDSPLTAWIEKFFPNSYEGEFVAMGAELFFSDDVMAFKLSGVVNSTKNEIIFKRKELTLRYQKIITYTEMCDHGIVFPLSGEMLKAKVTDTDMQFVGDDLVIPFYYETLISEKKVRRGNQEPPQKTLDTPNVLPEKGNFSSVIGQ